MSDVEIMELDDLEEPSKLFERIAARQQAPDTYGERPREQHSREQYYARNLIGRGTLKSHLKDPKDLDVEEERLLKHFALPEQQEIVVEHLEIYYGKRPETFEERMSIAEKLKGDIKERLARNDQNGAMLFCLCALYCLDFHDAAIDATTTEQRGAMWLAMAQAVANVALVALKRKTGGPDNYNALRASDCCLKYLLPKIAAKEHAVLLPKVHFRRAQALLGFGEVDDAAEAIKTVIKLTPNDKAARELYEKCRRLKAGTAARGDHAHPWLARFMYLLAGGSGIVFAYYWWGEKMLLLRIGGYNAGYPLMAFTVAIICFLAYVLPTWA